MREKVVLVIDDDDMNLQIAKMVLEKKVKCRVICVDNGRAGIEILRKERVNLVLLDIMMPDFDGIETLEEIRADEDLKNTTVMMLTAANGIDHIKKVYHLGVKDYIKKPFMPADLISRVNKKFADLEPDESILLIGTEIYELKTMKELIEKNFEYDTFIAQNEHAVWKILNENKITLIIADAAMTFIDGVKMLAFVASEKKLAEVPFAVTTSDKIIELIDKIKAPPAEEKTDSPIAEKIAESIVIHTDKNKLNRVVTSLIGYELDVRG